MLLLQCAILRRSNSIENLDTFVQSQLQHEIRKKNVGLQVLNKGTDDRVIMTSGILCRCIPIIRSRFSDAFGNVMLLKTIFPNVLNVAIKRHTINFGHNVSLCLLFVYTRITLTAPGQLSFLFLPLR